MSTRSWLIVVFAFALPAAAEPIWRTEARLDLPTAIAPNPTTPIRVSERLTGTYWIEPLIDDTSHPLALLGFFQHPDTVSVALSGTATQSGTLSGTIWPWARTGFTGSAGIAHASGSDTLTASYSLGAEQYIGRFARVDLSYAGSRSRGGFLSGGGANTLRSTSGDNDRGHLGVLWVLPGEAFSVAAATELGRIRSASSSVPSGAGTLATSEAYGVSYLGSLTATTYMGRHISTSLNFALRGQVRTGSTGDVPTDEVDVFNPSISPALQIFLLDSVLLRLSYQLDWTRTQAADGSPPVDSIGHSATLAVAGRF